MPAQLALTVLIATGLTAGFATACAMIMQAKIKTVRVRTGQQRRAVD